MANKIKSLNSGEAKPDLLWRKPISLESFDEDPLAELYRGREVGQKNEVVEELPEKAANKSEKFENSAKIDFENNTAKNSPKKPKIIEDRATMDDTSAKIEEIQTSNFSTKITDAELKEILKIKDDFFHFTDIREVLRGKSYEIYAYLRFLSGDDGFCKIKHLDLMDAVNVSRPTLFKQQDWLIKLSLIEKRNVPGDHLGTSYTIHRLEEVLPLPQPVIKQIESHIEALRQTDN